ncbi:MAG: DUF1217 domain-containing protein [Rhodobacteraceae bacterium]|jgi:hypothetical protein|nr:DUF1217 domain-containing protein [Paracoccaceae bacterium]
MIAPALPFTGVAGWSFLTRTREAQQATFERQPQLTRDVDYFRANIAKVKTAEDLVSDRRLLTVALGAFGLSEDIGKKAFIQKILEGGTLNPDSLANRLPDKRYALMASTFAFELGGSIFAGKTFQDRIVKAFLDRSFETAIGEQSTSMRLALGLERDLGAILSGQNTENGYWFAVMGTPALRRVFETALGLPRQVAGIDIDRQLEAFKTASDRVFGTSDLREFADPERREDLIRRFVVRADLEGLDQSTRSGASGGAPGAVAALALLQSASAGGSAGGGILQILASRG